MFSFVGLFAAEKAAAEGEWPCFRGPNHDDKSPDQGLLKEWPTNGPAKLWQFSGLGKGFSTVAISGATVYASVDVDGQMTLFALDMDGKLKWKVAHDKAWTQSYTGSRSMPTVDGDMLYLVSGHGLIGCYSTRNGAKVWTRTMQELGGKTPNWGYTESVLINGTMAIVTPGGAGCITALDKATGSSACQVKDPVGHTRSSSAGAYTCATTPTCTASM
jgi:outer membrane protein assembly factor BamB